MGGDRARHRQGAVRVIGGVPYANRNSTLALLPGAAVGRWLAGRAGDLDGRLLDLGAGNQPFRAWYAQMVDQAVAVDITAAPGLDVLSAASRLPFRDACFDVILCTEVLEHVDDAESALREMARVLRPGGRLLITVPFLYPTHEAPYDFWRTTHFGLHLVIERNGLIVDDLAAQGGPGLLLAHYVTAAIAQAIRLLGSKLGRFGRIVDNGVLTALIAMPQEIVRTKVRYRLSPRSRVASLGYMAAAHRPEP